MKNKVGRLLSDLNYYEARVFKTGCYCKNNRQINEPVKKPRYRLNYMQLIFENGMKTIQWCNWIKIKVPI